MLLEQIIDFEVSCTLFEAASKFNLQQFENLPSWQDRMKYAQENLKELGRGSSRAAFLISNRYVLKMAIPEAGEKGIGQNKGEVTVFSNKELQPYVAAVYRNAKNFEWIISELARPMKSPQEFDSLANLDWGTFDQLVKMQGNWQTAAEEEIKEYGDQVKTLTDKMNRINTDAAKQNLGPKIQNLNNVIQKVKQTVQSPVFKAAIALTTKGNVSAGDVREWDHWAKTPDGRLIIIDYGFTKDLQSLYKKTA